MQFRNSRNTSRTVGVDMTPMIDIVFQLLIFFLVTAQMAQQTRIELDLPKERGEETEENELAGLTINVRADGVMVVNDRECGFGELDQLIAEAAGRVGSVAELRPLIRADRACDAARLNDVFNHLSARGLVAIRLATERSR
ncbi:MAG: hypothetical protein RL136_213 [Planctomycetota bacterium]